MKCTTATTATTTTTQTKTPPTTTQTETTTTTETTATTTTATTLAPETYSIQIRVTAMTDDEVDAAQLVVLQELLASVTDAVTSAGTVLGVTETTVEAGSHVGESRETGGVTGHGTTSNDITELFTSTTPSDYHAGTQTPVDATTFTTRRTTQITATLATVLDTNPTPSLSVASQSAAVQSTHGPSHDAASTTSTVITPMHTSSIEHMEFPVATRTVTAATMDDITGKFARF